MLRVLQKDHTKTRFGWQTFTVLRLLYIGVSMGLAVWALWATSWIFRYGSIRLIEPSSMIVSMEVVALTIFLAMGTILAFHELKRLATIHAEN